GVDALDGSVDHPARLFHGDLAAIRLTEELRLQREVDRARRDAEGQLLGSRSYSLMAMVNGSAMPLPNPSWALATQRSTAAPVSARRARSRPQTPSSRGIARSGPSVVEARARAPHAPASVSALSASRSIE